MIIPRVITTAGDSGGGTRVRLFPNLVHIAAKFDGVLPCVDAGHAVSGERFSAVVAEFAAASLKVVTVYGGHVISK